MPRNSRHAFYALKILHPVTKGIIKMLIIAGWVLIAGGVITAIIVIITAYKSGLPNEIKELKMIKSSGFASEHSTEVKHGNIYRDKGIPEANIPRRERTVSASARELLKEVEAERAAERREGTAARNRFAKAAENQSRDSERKAAPKMPQNRPSTKDPAGTDVLPSQNVFNDNQGTDILRMGDTGVQVSAGTDILFVNESYSEENLPQETETIRKSSKKRKDAAGTDILPTEKADSIAKDRTDVLATEVGTDMLDSYDTDVLPSETSTDVLTGESGTDILPSQKESAGTDVLRTVSDAGTDILTSESSQTDSKPRQRGTDILREEGTDVLFEETKCAKTQCMTDTSRIEGTEILKETSTDILR